MKLTTILYSKVLAFVFCWLSVTISASSSAQVNKQSYLPLYEHVQEIVKLAKRQHDPRLAALFAEQQAKMREKIPGLKRDNEQELSRLASSMKPQELDKFLMDRSIKAGAPADVLSAVNSFGGGAKVIAQTEKLSEDFLRTAQASLASPKASLSVDDFVAALLMVQPADARWRGGMGCSLFVWAISMGTAADANYKLCMS